MRNLCLLAALALLPGQTARAASATVVDDTFAEFEFRYFLNDGLSRAAAGSRVIVQ